jgi:hypothetical protein
MRDWLAVLVLAFSSIILLIAGDADRAHAAGIGRRGDVTNRAAGTNDKAGGAASREKLTNVVTLHESRSELFEVTTAFPHFLEPSPFHQELNVLLRSEIGAIHRMTVRSARQVAREQWRAQNPEDRSFYRHSYDIRYFITYTDRDLVSISMAEASYTGGAHGNARSAGHNYWFHNGKVIRLQLSHLFSPRSNYRRRLESYCLASLRRQGASNVVDGEMNSVDADELANFTLSSKGIIITFDPYRAGCYAEGPYTVVVPFRVLKDLIPNESPIHRFVTKRK